MRHRRDKLLLAFERPFFGESSLDLNIDQQQSLTSLTCLEAASVSESQAHSVRLELPFPFVLIPGPVSLHRSFHRPY